MQTTIRKSTRTVEDCRCSKEEERLRRRPGKNWDFNSVKLFEMETKTGREALPEALKVQDMGASEDVGIQDAKTEPATEMDKVEKNAGMLTCQTTCSENNIDGDSAFMSEGEACDSTPSSGAETMDLSSSFDQTEDDSIGCQTPRASIFDPFAAGPEELALAPKKKMLKETRIALRRQLNFDLNCYPSGRLDFETSEDDAEEEDGRVLELLCKSFLELIVSNQISEVSTEELMANQPESPKTPTSLPFLTGIAETCPPAPRRPTAKLRILDQEICRKLNFGFGPNFT